MKTQKVNFPNKFKMLFLDYFFKDDSVVFRGVSENYVAFYNAAQLYYAYLGIHMKKIVTELFKSSVIWHEKNL